MLQLQRCQWRYDVWISDEPLVDVGTVDGDSDPDLGCTISHESKELSEPVGDLSQLVEVSGYDLGTQIDWHWEHNDNYGVGTQFPGSKLLYNSQEAKVGPAGRPQAIDDDGCTFTYPFQIWRKPPAAPQPSEPELADSHVAAMVTDFQESLGSVFFYTLCFQRSAQRPSGTGTGPQPVEPYGPPLASPAPFRAEPAWHEQVLRSCTEYAHAIRCPRRPRQLHAEWLRRAHHERVEHEQTPRHDRADLQRGM